MPTTQKTRYLPVREMRRPVTTDAPMIPQMIGNIRIPDPVADAPWADCRKSGTKTSAPNIEQPRTKLSEVTTENTRSRNSRIGGIGSAVRDSCATKAMATTIPPAAIPTIVGEPHR